MSRDIFKFLCGAAVAGTYVHVFYAVAIKRGTISVPIWRGREWGVGKILTEAVVYGAISVVLGYLGWRPERREMPQPESSRSQS